MQSCEAGGHGANGASLITLIPELVDHVSALCQKLQIQPAVPVVAAGGIVDARQVCSLHVQKLGIRPVRTLRTVIHIKEFPLHPVWSCTTLNGFYAARRSPVPGVSTPAEASLSQSVEQLCAIDIEIAQGPTSQAVVHLVSA